MFSIITKSFLAICGGFITWFTYASIRDHLYTIDIPLKGEDRLAAFIRRSVVHDD